MRSSQMKRGRQKREHRISGEAEIEIEIENHVTHA
jgi:hypothetical protein